MDDAAVMDYFGERSRTLHGTRFRSSCVRQEDVARNGYTNVDRIRGIDLTFRAEGQE